MTKQRRGQGVSAKVKKIQCVRWSSENRVWEERADEEEGIGPEGEENWVQAWGGGDGEAESEVDEIE